MSKVFTLRSTAYRLVSWAVHCLHGSFLTVGVAAAIGCAGLISHGIVKYQSPIYHFQQWASVAGLSAAHREQGASDSVEGAAEESDGDVDLPLDGRMRAVADYVARRYRVAPLAVAPLMRTAREAAIANGLDPLLVVAVIGVESGFNPYSESVVGAQGLMQVVGRFHGDKLGNDSDGMALLDPVTNIQVGTRVLRDSIRRAGSLMPGLQQYAGAPDDPDQTYAGKVMAERMRMLQAIRRTAGNGV